MAFLRKRSGILDGVCITGGEPLLQPDLEEVLKKMADSATKGDTVKLGCFKKLSAQDMYEIYKAANHR